MVSTRVALKNAQEPLNAITWAATLCPKESQDQFLNDWMMGDFGEWVDYWQWAQDRHVAHRRVKT